ncbi:hypothetical protein ACTMTU_18110 [Streptomyces sp. OZ13]|uniref:hypothetical protein n=1 Tax=Streptomyces sp. OZ13 TaxID=3452210 RepID=UPI003F8B248A
MRAPRTGSRGRYGAVSPLLVAESLGEAQRAFGVGAASRARWFRVAARLAEARAARGPTAFDWLVEIIEDELPGGLRLR